MSMISAVRDYLAQYSGLKSGTPVWVDYLGAVPTEYAVLAQAGEQIIERWLNGGSLREFPFAFQSMENTADNLERLENLGFYETFAGWLETQTDSGVFPTLGAKQTPLAIEALGWGYLYEQGVSDTGVYQVQCKLTYEQQP